VHPAVRVGPSTVEGRGLFATADLLAGTVVVVLGGRVVGTEELRRLIVAADADPDTPYVDTVGLDGGRHLVLDAGTPAHFGNHSCEPNLWHEDAVTVVARRDVAAGEELTVDYATQTTEPGWAMTCRCGAASCRGQVTGRDWARGDLQVRYGRHWVPALLRRIDAGVSGPSAPSC
jgi:uncharacterized protein